MGMIFFDKLEYLKEQTKDYSVIWDSQVGRTKRLIDVMGRFSALLWVVFLMILTAIVKFLVN